MKSVPLNAFARTAGRRAGSKKLRESGRIPAVIYGRKAAPQNLEVNTREMQELMKHALSETLLIDLKVAEDARPDRLALLRERGVVGPQAQPERNACLPSHQPST